MKKPTDNSMIIHYEPTTEDMYNQCCWKCGKGFGVRHGVMLDGVNEEGEFALVHLCVKCSKRTLNHLNGKGIKLNRVLYWACYILVEVCLYAFIVSAGASLYFRDVRYLCVGVLLHWGLGRNITRLEHHFHDEVE